MCYVRAWLVKFMFDFFGVLRLLNVFCVFVLVVDICVLCVSF